MNSYPQAQDGGNKFVEGLAAGGLLAGLGYFSLNPQRRAEARQKIANLVNPNAKSATAGTRQGDLGEKTKTKAPTETERSNLGVAQATRVKQEVPVEQVPASPAGALVKPSSSPSDLLARTVDEVSVKILDDPQPQIPGGSLGQGILTSYPTTSQRKAAYDAAAAKPVSELPAVTRPSSGVDVELITDPVTGEKFAPGRSPAGTTPRSYLEDQGFVANTMVDQQDARVGLQVDQSVAAINSAEDQATGRVMRRLQANEDLDIGAVNAAKEQAEAVLEDTISRNPQLASDTPLDAAVNSVARSLPDGLPVDQTEKTIRLPRSEPVSTSPEAVDTYLKQYPENTTAVSAVEPESNEFLRQYQLDRGRSRLQEIQARTSMGPGASRGGLPSGAEGTRVKQALDLYAGTGDPAVLSLMDESPSLPLRVTPQGVQSLTPGTTGVVSTGDLYKPFGVQEMGTRYDPGTRTMYEPGLTAPINEAEKRFQVVEEAKLKDFPSKYRVQKAEEGSRLYFEQDPATGKPIAETMELRVDRPAIDLKARGGGGRNLAEYSAGSREDEQVRQVRSGGRMVRMRDYDTESIAGQPAQKFESDRSQTGREVDIYGIRPSTEKPAEPEMRPSKPGRSLAPLTQQPTEAGRRSIDASEEIRRIRATNPPDKAQTLVNTFLGALGGN